MTLTYVRSKDAPRVEPSSCKTSEAEAAVVGAMRLRRMVGDVETWQSVKDPDELTALDPSEVIWGSVHEITNELRSRYDVADYLTRVDYTSGWRPGWEIENHQQLLTADVGLLTAACSEHGKVLVSHRHIDDTNPEFNRAQLERQGFVFDYRGSRNAYLVTYNPRTNVVRAWRTQVESASRFMQNEFNIPTINAIWAEVHPRHWGCTEDGDGGLLTTEKNVTDSTYSGSSRGWGRCRRARYEQTLSSDAPRLILKMVEFARKLYPGKNTWRSSEWPKRLENDILPYFHHVEMFNRAELERKTAQGLVVEETAPFHWLRLCKWLRAEARAVGVKIPPVPVLPPRPLTLKQQQELKRKQLAARRRKRAEKKAQALAETETKASKRRSRK